MSPPLRLVVYDATQRARPPRALGLAWQAGSYLYRGLGRIDDAFGARDWGSALKWLVERAQERPIAEVQYWGHGRWGRALIDGESFDRTSLASGHALERGLSALRERLAPNALVWFRTCETLGARSGQAFAQALGESLGARVAGHTFVIGYFQSGLHLLPPGAAPSWSPSEGLARGTPDRPEFALSSSPKQPNTITCLSAEVPAGF